MFGLWNYKEVTEWVTSSRDSFLLSQFFHSQNVNSKKWLQISKYIWYPGCRILEQEWFCRWEADSLWPTGKSCPYPVSIKSLLEHSHTHLCIIQGQQSRVWWLRWRQYNLESLKYLLYGPLWKFFPTPCIAEQFHICNYPNSKGFKSIFGSKNWTDLKSFGSNGMILSELIWVHLYLLFIPLVILI